VITSPPALDWIVAALLFVRTASYDKPVHVVCNRQVGLGTKAVQLVSRADAEKRIEQGHGSGRAVEKRRIHIGPERNSPIDIAVNRAAARGWAVAVLRFAVLTAAA